MQAAGAAGARAHDNIAIEPDRAARFADTLLCWACSAGARALCLRWHDSGGTIHARLHGVGLQVAAGSAAQLDAIAQALVGRLHALPAHGQVAVLLAGHAFDLRLGPSSPCGRSLRLRIRERNATIRGLDASGLEAEDLALVRRLVSQPQGLVLVAGPTDGGRTATLYAMLDSIDPLERGVRTIEYPVAAMRRAWQQWTATQSAGRLRRQWRVALDQALDDDPGALLFDVRSARAPVRRLLAAVEAGWLVFAPVALERALHVFGHFAARGIAPADLARALSLVVAQRLAATLCDACALPDESPELRSVLARASNSWLRAETAHARRARPGGCAHCDGRGYRGRALLYEALEVGAGVRAMVAEGLSAQEMELSALGEGRSLWDQGLRLLARGRISLASLRAALREPG